MNKLKDDVANATGRLIQAGVKLGLVGLPILIASTAIPGLTGVIIGVLGAGTVIEAMRTKNERKD